MSFNSSSGEWYKNCNYALAAPLGRSFFQYTYVFIYTKHRGRLTSINEIFMTNIHNISMSRYACVDGGNGGRDVRELYSKMSFFFLDRASSCSFLRYVVFFLFWWMSDAWIWLLFRTKERLIYDYMWSFIFIEHNAPLPALCLEAFHCIEKYWIQRWRSIGRACAPLWTCNDEHVSLLWWNKFRIPLRTAHHLLKEMKAVENIPGNHGWLIEISRKTIRWLSNGKQLYNIISNTIFQLIC